VANLAGYTIPNLIQGISMQPDASREPSQGEIQINGMSSLAEGLRKREPTQAVRKVSTSNFGDVYFHQILRDSAEQYLVVVGKTAIKVFDLAGNEKTVTPATNAYNYFNSVVSAKADIRAATIADYTFISNTKEIPAMKSDTAPATSRPADHEALVWIKAANYGQTYKVNVNGTLATVQTAVAPVVVSGGSTTENRISTAEIAESVKTALSSVSGVTITRNKSVLHLTSANAITLSAEDARGNADITAITNTVQAFTDLPTIAPTGYQVEIAGDPGNNFDGFHCEFVPRTGAGTFGEGQWQETVKPGDKYIIDEDKMPHILVRKADGTFYFGPADGSTVGGIDLPAWGNRTAGNEESAKDPSFIGFPIQDVFIYKNRLGFLADENIILSRAREFFQFFPETVTGVLDSDPIDLQASNTKVSVLRYAIPYQDELIIFSDQIQFRFNAAETILTPASAVITVLTQYEIDPDCRPIPVAGTIIFCQANGQWSQFREFSVRGAGTALVADASDLTGYVSSFIPSDVFKLTGNDTGNSWFVLSSKTGYKDRIYVFKYFYRNTGQGAERAQSSWSYWQLTGADEILSVLCVEEILYALVRYGTDVWLEKMAVSDRLSDVTPDPYPIMLDRRVTTKNEGQHSTVRVSAGTYSAITKKTTWTLPYTVATKTEAWSGYDTSANGGVLLGTITSGNTITADGDWSSSNIFFGEPYNFRYRFTKFKLYKEIGGGKAAANTERTQVRHANLRYHETWYFEIQVMAERRDTAVYKYDRTTINVRNSMLGTALPSGWDVDDKRYYEGVFRVPIASKGENCVIEIHNDSAHPCKFSTCEWVGLITSKARSIQ
jgi:hypothetical protein